MSNKKNHVKGCIHRRDFSKLVALGAATAALPGAALAAGPAADVILTGVEKGAPDSDVAAAVKKAALAATDFAWLSRGDTVVIKPVVNSGNDYPATTDPASLKTMAELLLKKGAGRVIATDFSSIGYVTLGKRGLKRGSSRALMERCSLARAAEEGGAELYFAEEDGWDAFYEETPRSRGRWKKPLMMPSILEEADHIVLMPRCGRHMMAGNTLGLKAAVGYWRPDTRIRFHADMRNVHEMIADANTVPALLDKQRLVLTTATKVLTTKGPDNGYVHQPETGLVIASESVVAHDMVSLAWLLEGCKATPKGEKDRKYLDSIWDCRILNRAYESFDGVPKVALQTSDGSVPSDILETLAEHTTNGS